MNVLVTGASGFIGDAVVRRLAGESKGVRAASRTLPGDLPGGVERIRVGDLDAATDWREALLGMDAVVHASARVHVMRESARDPLAEFRRVNVEGTLALARAAAAAGARRFVFISSVKVNGERTEPGAPFTADDKPAPADAYGISKLEAERGLFDTIARDTALEVVVIRPVLVYGPGVKGNFLEMMRWLAKGVPLPLGAVRNRRSLVALDNLVDLIATCLGHPAAAGQVFLVSDGDDLSTPDLLRRTARALGRTAHLIPVPVAFLRGAASLAGRSDAVDRLCGSLQVDLTKTNTLLGWRPPIAVDEGLRRAAELFMRSAASQPAARR